MNEHAKEVLAQLLQRVLDGVDSAVEFSQQEIPEVIEQLLLWHFVDSAISTVIAFFMGVALVYGWGRFFKTFGSEEISEEVTVFCSVILFIFSCAWCVLAYYVADLTWLKIWIAPKLYLLEYGATLIK